MSRLNTMYPNDDFLKGISNVMGKIDSKNETQIKEEIEQIGYKEFYRYYKEKDVYIKQLKEDYNKVVHESTEFESKVYQLQERIDKVINGIETTISIIKQHPSKDEGLDFYIISKLESFVKILKGDKE